MCTVIPITKTLGPRGMTCPSLLRAERILRLMVLALGMAKLQALNACETDEINQVRWIAEIPDANLSNDGGPVTNGGESGIRTHVTLSSKHAFQACAFSHSAISPADWGLRFRSRSIVLSLQLIQNYCSGVISFYWQRFMSANRDGIGSSRDPQASPRAQHENGIRSDLTTCI